MLKTWEHKRTPPSALLVKSFRPRDARIYSGQLPHSGRRWNFLLGRAASSAGSWGGQRLNLPTGGSRHPKSSPLFPVTRSLLLLSEGLWGLGQRTPMQSAPSRAPLAQPTGATTRQSVTPLRKQALLGPSSKSLMLPEVKLTAEGTGFSLIFSVFL